MERSDGAEAHPHSPAPIPRAPRVPTAPKKIGALQISSPGASAAGCSFFFSAAQLNDRPLPPRPVLQFAKTP